MFVGNTNLCKFKLFIKTDPYNSSVVFIGSYSYRQIHLKQGRLFPNQIFHFCDSLGDVRKKYANFNIIPSPVCRESFLSLGGWNWHSAELVQYSTCVTCFCECQGSPLFCVNRIQYDVYSKVHFFSSLYDVENMTRHSHLFWNNQLIMLYSNIRQRIRLLPEIVRLKIMFISWIMIKDFFRNVIYKITDILATDFSLGIMDFDCSRINLFRQSVVFNREWIQLMLSFISII
jgi:hypothetical protein